MRGEGAADGVEAAVDADGRVDGGFAVADPLLVAPVEAADGGGGGVVAGGVEEELAGDAADGGVGEVGEEGVEGAGVDAWADVDEEDDFAGGGGDAVVEGGGFAAWPSRMMARRRGSEVC